MERKGWVVAVVGGGDRVVDGSVNSSGGGVSIVDPHLAINTSGTHNSNSILTDRKSISRSNTPSGSSTETPTALVSASSAVDVTGAVAGGGEDESEGMDWDMLGRQVGWPSFALWGLMGVWLVSGFSLLSFLVLFLAVFSMSGFFFFFVFVTVFVVRADDVGLGLF